MEKVFVLLECPSIDYPQAVGVVTASSMEDAAQKIGGTIGKEGRVYFPAERFNFLIGNTPDDTISVLDYEKSEEDIDHYGLQMKFGEKTTFLGVDVIANLNNTKEVMFSLKEVALLPPD